MLKVLRRMFIISSFLFLIIGFIFNNFNVILVSIILLWCNNIFYSLDHLSKRIIFLFFNLTFFVFVLGRYTVQMIKGLEWWSGFPAEVMLHTLSSLYLSLLLVLLGAVFYDLFYKEKGYTITRDNLNVNSFIYNIRFVSKILFYISFIFSIVVLMEKVIFVQSNSYLALYTDYTSNLPFLFYKIADANILLLYIYLATLPKKSEAKMLIVLYILSLLTSILTGVRGEFVFGLLVLLIYAIFRDKKYSDIDVKWISKPIKVLMIVAMPFLIVFLSLYNVIRIDGEVEYINLLNEIFNFFEAQGGSVNVISYGKLYDGNLPDSNLSYTFGPIINYFTNGTVANILTGAEPIRGNTIQAALFGNNFAQTISYLVNPNYFVSGWGLGSQYIAEVFADFGYIGLIIFNFLLGCLLVWVPTVLFKRWWTMVLGLQISSSLFYLPRGSALSFMSYFYSLTFWFTLTLVLLLAKIFTENKKSAGLNYEKNNNE